ncbi:flagellar motor protein PomA [Vibrio mediterranei]|uniref:flagellar motor protein PomA n=1 Tax=Vibrio mediterranei TaxID=689 RepID=UPI000D17FC58|nr:flagellar motor protein PomA [Vibrio mediterranei]PTC04300.1 flagellar motor protein PomA [Vibrio mediterranei]
MDLATFIGLIGGFAAIIIAMGLDGTIMIFYNTTSIFIVIGGSTFVVLMKFTLTQFLNATKIAGKAFMFKIDEPESLIAQIYVLADASRKGGFLALEEINIQNSFLQKGIELLVDGHDEEIVSNSLRLDIAQTEERHVKGTAVFKAFGEISPAMGMIGTLIGLVAMLSNMQDPKSIGPAMAIALLTTLYGAILSNMLFFPIADKLALRREQEKLNRLLIMDGVLAIQNGQNPRAIDNYLKNYLNESKRDIQV